MATGPGNERGSDLSQFPHRLTGRHGAKRQQRDTFHRRHAKTPGELTHIGCKRALATGCAAPDRPVLRARRMAPP